MRNRRTQRKNSQYTKDHLVSKEKGGSSCEDNIHRKKRGEHTGKHTYLFTKLFHNQLISIIDENKPTLLPEAIEIMEEFKERLRKLMVDQEMYKKSCFKYGKYPKR